MTRFVRFTWLLVGIDFLDELSSGVPMVGAPDAQADFGLSYGTTALILFVIPQAAGLLLEPPLYVLADRAPRRRFVVGGLAAMGVASLVAAAAASMLVFALAIAAFAVASGVGVNLGQATLMDTHPDRREQMMARWALSGTLGDLAAPAVLGVLAFWAFGWRLGFVLVGGALIAYALVLSRESFPVRRREPDAPGVRASILAALSNRRLFLWLFGVWLCGLLDEVLVAFAALHLRDGFGASATERSVVLMLFVAGGAAGLAATERLAESVAPLRVLQVSGAVCAACFVAWIQSPTLLVSGITMTFAGFFAAPLYPIAQAQAYRTLPDESGMVNAAGALFHPLSLALPYLLGLVADHFGLTAALLTLTAQPIGLLAIASVERLRARRQLPA